MDALKVQPEQFGLSDGEQIFQKASRLAVEGQFLYEEHDAALGALQLVVVGQFKEDQRAARQQVDEILKRMMCGCTRSRILRRW